MDRLGQRYCVLSVLSSLRPELKIIAVRNVPKVLNDLNSLKINNEDLNTLEIFAIAHDDAEKLSGLLFLDTASGLFVSCSETEITRLFVQKRNKFESSWVGVFETLWETKLRRQIVRKHCLSLTVKTN